MRRRGTLAIHNAEYASDCSNIPLRFSLDTILTMYACYDTIKQQSKKQSSPLIARDRQAVGQFARTSTDCTISIVDI
jgi:hypothetical protein